MMLVEFESNRCHKRQRKCDDDRDERYEREEKNEHNRPLLPSLGSTLSVCSTLSMSIDTNYNFDLPSHQVYMSETEGYYGEYSQTRESLDKHFHGFYTRDRQLVQDQIISYALRSSGSMKKQEKPWIIFTAGAMGSGKSHTLRYLRQNNILTELESYVIIDQDEIRSLLPEWHGYVKNSEHRAGSLLQKESGYMCEIALAASMDSSRNIIFDSSLKDTNWWKSEFKRIREQYPQYRIAIMYMKTDLQVTLQRNEARAIKTGRVVPKEKVVDSFKQSANSFELLKNLTDLNAVINTGTKVPTFSSPSLQQFKAQWTHM